MRSEMAKPAASSLALLTRKPDDSLCIERARSPPVLESERCEFNDTVLVVMLSISVS